MPWPPSQRLIIGEAALAFGVFESALDPVALPLHLGQSEPRRIGGGVREAVFDRLDRSNLAPDDQMPASRSLFLAVPDPDPAGRDVNPRHYGSVGPASASFDPHRFWSQHRVCRPVELGPSAPRLTAVHYRQVR